MSGSDSFGRSHYSTAKTPAGNRHRAWSERGWPSIAALFESTPIGEFSTSAEDFNLGGIAISYAFGTARLLERSPERIAADGIDILGIGLLLDGEMQGTAASREFEARAGEVLLLDVSQPITMTMSTCRSVQVALPRPVAEARLGDVAALHGIVIPQVAAAACHDYLLHLRASLQAADPDDPSHLADRLVASLAQAMRSAGLSVAP